MSPQQTLGEGGGEGKRLPGTLFPLTKWTDCEGGLGGPSCERVLD